MRDVIFTLDAENDLADLSHYLSKHDASKYVSKLINSIVDRAELIPFQPQAGRIVDEIEPFGLYEYRQILHKPYWIFYHFDDDTVWIDAVIDSRRKIEDQLYQRFMK